MEKCAEETDGNCTLPALKLGATMRALGENISDRDAMRLALQSSIIDSRGTLSCLLVCVRARGLCMCNVCVRVCSQACVCSHASEHCASFGLYKIVFMPSCFVFSSIKAYRLSRKYQCV